MLRKVSWKLVLLALLVGGLVAVLFVPLFDAPSSGAMFGLDRPRSLYTILRTAMSPPPAQPVVEAPGELAAIIAPSHAPRLIVYTAHMSLVVPDTEAALAQVEQLATRAEGYVTASSTQQYEEGSRANITIRVPSERLDEVVEQLRELALEVRSENRSGENVTEEYVDLNARLQIMEAAEQELLELYQTRQASGEVSDILEVYQQLVTFRQEIEALTGRIQYLEQSAALATITVELTPDVLAQPIEVGGWRPQGTARAALQALLSGLQFLADAVIWFVIFILPLVVLVGVPAYIIWRLLRRRRQAPNEQTGGEEPVEE